MNHHKLYEKAYYYDLLFQFKNIKNENQTLLDIYEEINGQAPLSFLDCAAGPAVNSIEMSQRGLKTFAIDYSQEMVEYGMRKASNANVQITYQHADMRDFALPQPVDLAAMFMISTCYLLTNEDMVQHLKVMASNLNAKGIYVLEMAHPEDLFAVGRRSWSNYDEERWGTKWEERWEEKWSHADEDTHVSIEWGGKDDYFDPLTQVRMLTCKLKYKTPHDAGEIIDHCPQREYTFQEMRALIALSGVFELKKALGDWNTAVPCSNDKASWRMILVLQKI